MYEQTLLGSVKPFAQSFGRYVPNHADYFAHPEQYRVDPFSIYGNSKVGTFKFCMLRCSVSPGSVLSRMDERILSLKYKVREIAGSQADWYGLKNSALIIENVPLSIPSKVEPSQKAIRIKD